MMMQKDMAMKQTALSAALLTLSSGPVFAAPERTDYTTTSDPGTTIAIREVIDPDQHVSADPVLLIHGARVPGIPSFDLPVAGGSLAADLAARGLAVYIVDLRGYGGSTRPAAMQAPADTSAPLVRSGAAVRDIAAAVDAVRARTASDRVALLGWATGGHWAGMYAASDPDKVSRLVLYNALYGYTPDHPVLGRGSRLSDPDNPDRFNIDRFRSYRLNAADGLLPGWDRSIPIDDKSAWRDPAVAEAYVEAALASDSTSGDRSPPSFRAPSGAMADSFLIATGAALWDARLITADTLIVRSQADFWSRAADVDKLLGHLNARSSGTAQAVTIPEATHFVHLDRPERGRELFLDAVGSFLTGSDDRS